MGHSDPGGSSNGARFSFSRLPLFAENSHRGHHVPNSTFRLGTTLAISNTVTGLPGCLYDSGTRPCCSSKERDAETGLDYFGARYLSSAQGRFTSADLPLYDQSPFDPQSWNLYSYGRNNPLVNVDPSGRSCVKTQTVNPDGSTSGSSADDGDGKGCEAAGIKPDDKGGLAASGQQVNVSGKQGSLWD
jgi:RHS repeat-associated protein